MKVQVDTLHAMYKVRMMGITISGPRYAHVDNMLVIHNTLKPESMLKKNAIAHYSICVCGNKTVKKASSVTSVICCK